MWLHTKSGLPATNWYIRASTPMFSNYTEQSTLHYKCERLLYYWKNILRLWMVEYILK